MLVSHRAIVNIRAEVIKRLLKVIREEKYRLREQETKQDQILDNVAEAN